MSEYSAPRVVRWLQRQARAIFQRRRVWPGVAQGDRAAGLYASDEHKPGTPEAARDVAILFARVKGDGGGEASDALACKAFEDLVDDEMKAKVAYYAAVKATAKGHQTLLGFLHDLGAAYKTDTSIENEPRWHRQLKSLRATSRGLSSLAAASSGPAGRTRNRSVAISLSKMLSVLLMFTFAAGAAAQFEGLPCTCAAESSGEQAALCENMLLGGDPEPDIEDLCRSSIRLRDTYCETQEDKRKEREKASSQSPCTARLSAEIFLLLQCRPESVHAPLT